MEKRSAQDVESTAKKRKQNAEFSASDIPTLQTRMALLNWAKPIRPAADSDKWNDLGEEFQRSNVPKLTSEYIMKGKPSSWAELLLLTQDYFKSARLIVVQFEETSKVKGGLLWKEGGGVKEKLGTLEGDYVAHIRSTKSRCPEWRLRIWSKQSNAASKIAALWCCAVEFQLNNWTAELRIQLSSLQKTCQQPLPCPKFLGGLDVCDLGLRCTEGRHDLTVPGKDLNPEILFSTEIASDHVCDFHCIRCGRLLGRAKDVFRIHRNNDSDGVWLRRIVNCTLIAAEEPRYNAYKATATPEFTCLCLQSQVPPYGYWHPKLRIWKLFIRRPDTNFPCVYWRVLTGHNVSEHITLPHPAPAPKRGTEEDMVKLHLASDIDSAAKMLEDPSQHQVIAEARKSLPSESECQVCFAKTDLLTCCPFSEHLHCMHCFDRHKQQCCLCPSIDMLYGELLPPVEALTVPSSPLLPAALSPGSFLLQGDLLGDPLNPLIENQ